VAAQGGPQPKAPQKTVYRQAARLRNAQYSILESDKNMVKTAPIIQNTKYTREILSQGPPPHAAHCLTFVIVGGVDVFRIP
jgi:hypothetical protein